MRAGVGRGGRGEQQAQVRMPPTARLVTHKGAACHKGMCIAREGRQGRTDNTKLHGITHLYGLAPAACCSVVMMGFRSCFLRFLPVFWLDEATLATFLAFSIAAFLIPSEPFILQRLRWYMVRLRRVLPGCWDQAGRMMLPRFRGCWRKAGACVGRDWNQGAGAGGGPDDVDNKATSATAI